MEDNLFTTTAILLVWGISIIALFLMTFELVYTIYHDIQHWRNPPDYRDPSKQRLFLKILAEAKKRYPDQFFEYDPNNPISDGTSGLDQIEKLAKENGRTVLEQVMIMTSGTSDISDEELLNPQLEKE